MLHKVTDVYCSHLLEQRVQHCALEDKEKPKDFEICAHIVALVLPCGLSYGCASSRLLGLRVRVLMRTLILVDCVSYVV